METVKARRAYYENPMVQPGKPTYEIPEGHKPWAMFYDSKEPGVYDGSKPWQKVTTR